MAASKVIALRISLELVDRIQRAEWQAAAMRKPGRNEMLRKALDSWASRMDSEFAETAPALARAGNGADA